LLTIEDNNKLERLFSKAYKIKQKILGNKVYFRGIIELSNICNKNCYYCGIRKDNNQLERYIMSKEEIVECALNAYNFGFGSIVLQSGERQDKYFIDFITGIIKEIKQKTNNKLGITLSLGEQDKETYKKWFEAGAHRYLLRIETSNRELYNKLHPSDHSFENRLNCLKELKNIGYQVGTGVIIGVPFQTLEDLANDIIFFKEIDADMIGMGPYILHSNTPLSKFINFTDQTKIKLLNLSLNMIAITRILMKNINIASTSALQVLSPIGREMGLKAGANIIMPNITPLKYRNKYLLYENKPCIDEKNCDFCLKKRIELIGEKIGYNEWGDSPHYFERIKKR